MKHASLRRALVALGIGLLMVTAATTAASTASATTQAPSLTTKYYAGYVKNASRTPTFPTCVQGTPNTFHSFSVHTFSNPISVARGAAYGVALGPGEYLQLIQTGSNPTTYRIGYFNASEEELRFLSTATPPTTAGSWITPSDPNYSDAFSFTQSRTNGLEQMGPIYALWSGGFFATAGSGARHGQYGYYFSTTPLTTGITYTPAVDLNDCTYFPLEYDATSFYRAVAKQDAFNPNPPTPTPTPAPSDDPFLAETGVTDQPIGIAAATGVLDLLALGTAVVMRRRPTRQR